jgi:hypothetical protein
MQIALQKRQKIECIGHSPGTLEFPTILTTYHSDL